MKQIVTYFNNKKWQEITRDERFFCSHLYHSIINREKEFVEWLNNNPKINLNPNNNWEVGYEVCFYRDLIHHWKDDTKRKIKSPKQYSPKRTFDLCLFSNTNIVIIEAKVQQGFTTKQLIEIRRDKKSIRSLLGQHEFVVDIQIVLLHSSLYSPRNEFPKIKWIDLYNSFDNNKLFKRADGLYRK